MGLSKEEQRNIYRQQSDNADIHKIKRLVNNKVVLLTKEENSKLNTKNKKKKKKRPPKIYYGFNTNK